MFNPEVNLDIAAVTQHLSLRGVMTPRLLPTDDGALWADWEDGVWRALEYVQGVTHHRVSDPAMAREAGALVGRFHVALTDLEYTYRSGRSHVHDTPAHLRRLERALREHGSHRLFDAVAPLAEALLREAGRSPMCYSTAEVAGYASSTWTP